MTKRMSYTVGFKLKAIELAEATSNRNVGRELEINESLCGIGGRKKRNKSNYQEQCDLYSVKVFFTKVYTYTHVRLILRQIR